MRRAVLLVLVLSLILVGCGSSGESGTTDGAAFPGDRPPAPVEDVVLSIRGADEAIDLDIPGLRTLPMSDLETFEPFVEARTTFTGVSFGHLASALGLGDDTTLLMTALDDYSIEYTVGEFAENDAFLAYAENGDGIPVAAGGPIRIVFPDGSELGRNSDAWIWSLRFLDVR